MRALKAQWFEAHIPREQTVYALEALAETGQVELQKDLVVENLLDNKTLTRHVRNAERLVMRYRRLLPKVSPGRHLSTNNPTRAAEDALNLVRNWLARRIRLDRSVQAAQNKLNSLVLLADCVDAIGAEAESVPALYSAPEHRFLCKRVFACPLNREPPVGSSAVVESYPSENRLFHVVMCLPEQEALHALAFAKSQCEPIELPSWLLDNWDYRAKLIKKARQRLARRIARIDQTRQQHQQNREVVEALKQLGLLRWFLDRSVTLSEDKRHCRVTGWTTIQDPARLQNVLKKADIHSKLLFRPSPQDTPPPVDFEAPNPLASPFKMFVNFAGTPSELDPTSLLAFLVPLLFGLMFPDLGHGLVIALAGVAFARRFPRARLLIPCGLSAAAFGLLFGETFGSHQFIEPIVFCPYENPILTLGLSLLVGAFIILLGLILSGIEAFWRGEIRQWLWQDASVLTLYVTGLVSIFYFPALLGSVFALLWYLVGLVVSGNGQFFTGIGRLMQSAYELAINTLSFARVGAFALAHAALTHILLKFTAVIETDTLQLLLLAVGHTLIIGIEGMLVFIQTTRLIVFEFFTRFLHADGRLFRPVPGPNA